MSHDGRSAAHLAETKPSSGAATTAQPHTLGPQKPEIPNAGRWVLLVSILGSALVIIDVTAMNVVAPGIQKDLQTTVAGVQWVIEAYTLMLASVMLVGGALADRFGRRRIFGLGLFLFSIASLLCALAPGVRTLVAARAFQGLAGALMVPGSLALIGAHFPKETRGRAVGIWGGMSGLAGVAGPALGGILSDLGSWRWIFFVNVPIGLFLLLPLFFRVAESRRARANGSLDIGGAVWATLGLGALTYGLIQAGLAGWTDPTTLFGLSAGVVGLLLFVRQEATVSDPMMPLELFHERNFMGSNILTLFVYFALAAGMFFIPMRMIFLDGYSPTQAGLGMVPIILAISLLSPRMGAVTDRIGARPLLTGGPMIAGAGFLWLALSPAGTPYWSGYLVGLLVVGLGMSAVVAPLVATVLSSVPEDSVGVASGVNNAASRVAALMAIAVSGIIALSTFSHWLDASLATSSLDATARDLVWSARFDLAAADPPAGLTPTQAALAERFYDSAFGAAYRNVQMTMAGSAVLGGIAGLIWIRPHDPTVTPVE